MIKPFCYKCKKELIRPGAILLSPPNIRTGYENLSIESEHLDSIFKFHLCLECYNKTFSFISHYEENKESIGYSNVGT